MINYQDIQKANETIKTTSIQGKEYAEVNQRIKAFRSVCPEGFIRTFLTTCENGICIFRAEVGFRENDHDHVLGTGYAQEKEGANFINKTSYIENCETSAVGRALGMAGFGIDTLVASVEEVQNAIANQGEKKDDRKASPKQVEFLKSKYEGDNLKKLLKSLEIETLEDISMSKASDLIGKIKGGK